MRDQFLDTSKAILIFLVVFGHFLERMVGWNQPESRWVLSMIYAIHMPAFIFISGMLYKDKNFFKNIIFFLSLYLPFQILYPLFGYMLSGQFKFNVWQVFERPYWILWYLLGMMVWTWLTHLLIKTKYPCWIALICSLLIGLAPWNNYLYSVGRIFVFFPFFIVGAVYGHQILNLVKQQKYSLIWGITLLTALSVVIAQINLSRFWLYGSLSYQQLKVSALDGVLIRMGCLFMSVLGIYGLLMLIKPFAGRFTQLGTYTLPVYLLHGFVVIWLAQIGQFKMSLEWKILYLFIISVLVCCILRLKIFDDALRLLSKWLMWPYLKISRKNQL